MLINNIKIIGSSMGIMVEIESTKGENFPSDRKHKSYMFESTAKALQFIRKTLNNKENSLVYPI